MNKRPVQNLLPLQTASLGAQPKAVSANCLLELIGAVGSRAGQVAQSAGAQFRMAAAVLRMTCCRSLCKSPGRPLRGQEARERGSALCSQLLPGLPFALFYRSNVDLPTGILPCSVDYGVCPKGLSKAEYYEQ